MADVRLLGYGPHTFTTSSDTLIVACADRRRASRLTATIVRSAGSVAPISRARGSTATRVAQEYSKNDGTESAAAISASDTIQIDATGKDIAFTGSGFTGTLEFAVDSEQ